jgi:hypothetical protein
MEDYGISYAWGVFVAVFLAFSIGRKRFNNKSCISSDRL